MHKDARDAGFATICPQLGANVMDPAGPWSLKNVEFPVFSVILSAIRRAWRGFESLQGHSGPFAEIPNLVCGNTAFRQDSEAAPSSSGQPSVDLRWVSCVPIPSAMTR